MWLAARIHREFYRRCSASRARKNAMMKTPWTIALLMPALGCSRGEPKAPLNETIFEYDGPTTTHMTRGPTYAEVVAAKQPPVHELVADSLACALGPIVADEPREIGQANKPTALGPGGSACQSAATTVNVPASKFYSLEDVEVHRMREAIAGRCAVQGVSGEERDRSLAFFDRGIDAAREARALQDAWRGGHKPDAASPHLYELYELAEHLGTSELANEARAYAWTIAASDAMRARSVGFTALQPAAYLASRDGTTAMGGGPPEKSSGGVSTNTLERRLEQLSRQIPPSGLSLALDRTLVNLRMAVKEK
jgi:hypothetical protein